MSDSVDGTIQARGKTHGDYLLQAEFAQKMKDAMRETPNWNIMSGGAKESLDMIAVKISRILHGDPAHADSWHDIAGYARLIEGKLI